MIPRAHITAWRARAPWSTDAQVEQDLVVSRALVEIFSNELLAREVAFRGGTALYTRRALGATASALKRGCSVPAQHLYNTHPGLHTSLRPSSSSLPAACSGLM